MYKEFFNKKVTKDNAIIFLINGKKRDKSIYNYIVRKIISQLEVSEDIYPLGPSILIYNTKDILVPICYDKDAFILSKIDELDKNNSKCLTYSDEYFSKLGGKVIDDNEFMEKVFKNILDYDEEMFNKHYDNIKKWIEINISYNNTDMEEKIYQDSYNSYIKSVNNFNKYIDNLKQDIVSNYDIYKLVFLHDFKKDSSFEILDCLRTNMIGNMLIKCDNFYRDYDLGELRSDNRFFCVSIKPENIEEEMIKLNQEYNEIKSIEDIDEYIKRIIIVFQKFVKIHPYKDGNGRTSRLLLDVMLLNRNILPPVLYDTNYDRGKKLDSQSHEYTINGDEKPIVNFINKRIEETKIEYF